MPKQEHTYIHGRIRRAGTQDVVQVNDVNALKSSLRQKNFSGKVFSDKLKKEEVVARGNTTHYKKTSSTKKNKKSKWPKVVGVLGILMAFMVVAVSGAYIYADNFIFKTGKSGQISAENKTPVEIKPTTTNLLIIGVDHSEDGSEAYTNGLGRTDLILYINFNREDGKVNMLQIPRDVYVGDSVPTLGSGKINAAYAFGDDQDAPINNLVSVLNTQYKLPVDNYVMVDLDAFKSIVDALGGIRIYIPHELNSQGSKLPQGWNTLSGEQAEFFVRVRKGTGFMNGDIDRLDNQRYFYSALFHRFRNMSVKDLTKLLPIFQKYCTTDLNTNDVIPLASDFVNVDSENILLAKVPTAAEGVSGDIAGASSGVIYADREGTAELLNTYYRAHSTPVPVSELGLPKVFMPTNPALMYPSNVQTMGSDIMSTEEVDPEMPSASSAGSSNQVSSSKEK